MFNCPLFDFPGAGVCTQTDGMEDPQIIPDDNIDTPTGSTGSLRPDDEEGPLVIPPPGPGGENPQITIDLTSDKYPEAPNIGDLTPDDTENIDTITIFYKPPGSTTFVPLDTDGNGIPNVSIIN